ncbi:unnamed protein product [Mytilus edulis]|uniref:Uncharacterized protein n=1 Tax=Mytilus edulis TaxID=6550 RepID=A0A8S3R9R4_MYTED|nr:unnamed protein product [Mytilus edulis]
MFPRCNVGIFVKTQCGTSSHYQNELSLVKLFDCNRDISGHLHSLRLPTGQNQTKCDTQTEGQLISRRAGVFDYNRNLSICPKHRYDLGIYWRPRTTCQFPGHIGKGKPVRTVTSPMSYGIWCTQTQLVHAGSGICRKCIDVFKEVVPDITVYQTGLDSITDSNDSEKEEAAEEHSFNFTSDSSDNFYNLRQRTNVSYHNEFDDILECSSECTQATNSQTSNWSDNIQTPLSEINQALSTIGRGSISPLKFQLSKPLDDVKESTLRYIKRKATESIDVLLDSIAQSEAALLIRDSRDEEGRKMFQPEEYLLTSQVASYFSRLALLSRQNQLSRKEQDNLNDED